MSDFEINAKTCTLNYFIERNSITVSSPITKYIIPIYQRPYSWTEEQINKFLSDIFQGYWGVDGKLIREPIFIGTMQLGQKDLTRMEQHVIDGQQRLTTFLILLKVFKMLYPECKNQELDCLNWLVTRVNNGLQQKDLNELMSLNTLGENVESLNKYVANASIIKNKLKDLIDNGQKISDSETEDLFNPEDFVHYILSNIYFVVIETTASLSKTLQIFNSINTTGLDLNGGDVFKLRMYEYLCDKNKDIAEEDKNLLFEQISGIYEEIDLKNKEIGWKTDIKGILEIYKYILISKTDIHIHKIVCHKVTKAV